MKPKFSNLLLVASVVLNFSGKAHAATFTWDPTSVPVASVGGAGTWDTTNAFWSNGVIDSVWNNANNDSAVFGGTAGTVTIGAGGVNVSNLTFLTTGYTIAGGANVLTLSGTAPIIDTGSLASSSISAIVAGTSGFTKLGSGTLFLSGTNTISGNLAINAGTLAASGSTVSLASAGIVLNNGGTFTYGISNGSTNNATAANATNTINVVGNSNTTATIVGSGFSNGTTTNQFNLLVTGNGNISWGVSTLNIWNANIFQNYGGTVSWGSNGAGIRVSGGNTTQNMGLATLDLGSSTASLNTRATNNTAFIMGGLAGGSSTNLGSGTTGTANSLIVGSANGSQTFSGGLFQNVTSTNATSVTKVGIGTWTLNPTTSYATNATNLSANGGTLLADFTNLATATNLFKSTSTLAFGGGSLYFLGKSSGTTTQMLGAVTVNAGGGSLVVNPNGGTSTTLTLGTLTASAAGGTLNIQPVNNASGAITYGTGAVAITTTSTHTTFGTSAATSIYSPRITYGSDWAQGGSSGTPQLSSYSGYNTFSTTTGGTNTTNDTIANNLTLSGAYTTNTLKLTGAGTLGGGQTVTLTAGGLLYAGSGNYLIGGTVGSGTLKSNTATNSDLIIQQLGTGNLTINSLIANGTGLSTLTKGGSGTLTLAGTNTYTGQTFLNGGVTSISSNANVGAAATGAAVNFNGGTLQATATFALDNAGSNKRQVNIGGGGGTVAVTGANVFTISGTIANTAANQFGPLVKTGTGTLILSNGNSNTSYSGATIISGGILSTPVLANGGVTSGIGNSQATANALVLDGGTLQYTGAVQSTDRTFTITNNGGGLDASGSAALTFANTAPVVFSGSGTRTLTLGGTNLAANTLAAVIGDSASATSLVKSGVGQWVLSNANTYTGATTVNAGTLAVTGSLASGSAVAVNAGGTLAGTSVVSGFSTVAGSIVLAGGTNAASQGTINLANSNIETLNTGALTVGGSVGNFSQMNFNLGSSTADLISMGSNAFTVNTGGAHLTISLTGGTPASGTYDLLTFGSGAGAGFSTGTGNTVGSLALTNPSMSFGVSGSLNVTSTAVQLSISAAATPTTAYWLGNKGTNWASNDGTFGNFTSDKAGTASVTALVSTATDVIFAATGATNLTHTLGQDFLIKSLTFDATTAAVNISGSNFLNIGTGGLTLENGNGGATLGMTSLALGSAQTWTNASSNDLTVSANITGASGSTLAINNTSTGKTIFSGSGSTYSGATALNGGVLKAGSTGGLSSSSTYTLANTAGVGLDITGFNSSLGSLAGGGASGGNVTLGAATLSAGANNGSTTYAGVIDGTGGLTKVGTGTMTLTGTNLYTGPTTINAGTLIASGGTAIANTGAVVLANTAGANFNLANSETIGSLAGGGTTGGNVALGANTLTVGDATAATTYAGVISGTSGALTKAGAGILALTSANSYTGGTSINNGTLAIGGTAASNSGALGAGVVTVNSGAILRLGYAVSATSNLATVNNAITLAGGSIFVDDAFQHLGSTGTLNVTANSTLGSTYNSGANVATERNKGLFLDGVVSGSSNLTVQHSGISTGNSYNTSIVYFTNGANTYSGTITVSPMAGTNSTSGGSFLGINASNALQFATVNLDGNSAGQRFGTSPLVFNLGLGTATLGALAGSGDVVLTGYDETLHTYTGGGNIALTVGGNDATTSYSGIMSGAGSLTKTGTTGAGTLTLSGSNTFTGATTINNGTLYANTANAANGRALSFTSGITVNNGGTLQSSTNALFGWDGTQERLITVNAGGTLAANGGLTSDVGVGTVILNGGSMTTLSGGATDYGSFRFDDATDKLQVTDNSTISALNVKFGNASAALEVAAGKTANFTGTITDASVGGISYLNKTGTGTLTLSGTNTYTGATAVNAGTLVVNGNQSAATGNVSVSNTDTRLIGTGTVGGNTTINSGAIQSAGGAIANVDKVGLQTFDATGAPTTNLTFGSGSIFEWDLNANKNTAGYDDDLNGGTPNINIGTRGEDYDAVDVSGTLAVNATAIFRVVLGSSVTADAFWNQTQTWTDIFGGGVTLSGSGFTNSLLQVVNTSGGTFDQDSLFTGSGYGFSVSGSTLSWSAVPEPTSALAGLLIGAGLLRRRRTA